MDMELYQEDQLQTLSLYSSTQCNSLGAWSLLSLYGEYDSGELKLDQNLILIYWHVRYVWILLRLQAGSHMFSQAN